jgi:hypothetical protein
LVSGMDGVVEADIFVVHDKNTEVWLGVEEIVAELEILLVVGPLVQVKHHLVPVKHHLVPVKHHLVPHHRVPLFKIRNLLLF